MKRTAVAVAVAVEVAKVICSKIQIAMFHVIIKMTTMWTGRQMCVFNEIPN